MPAPDAGVTQSLTPDALDPVVRIPGSTESYYLKANARTATYTSAADMTAGAPLINTLVQVGRAVAGAEVVLTRHVASSHLVAQLTSSTAR
jgi:hypothetical protein